MHFLNCLVTELKAKILNKRAEFSCFPGKSQSIQLWGRAASFTSGPASAKGGSEELRGGKGPFTGRGGTALANASFFSQNISGLFPRRKAYSLSGTQFSFFCSWPKCHMNIQSKLGWDTFTPKEKSG